MQSWRRRTHDRRAVERKAARGKREVAREKPQKIGRAARQDTLPRGVEKETLCAIDEDDSENVEGATDNEEDLQAWCLSEESENEQGQEVITRRDKQRAKKANQASLLSVENSHNSS